MERTLAVDTLEKISQTVSVSGWVNSRRDHGGLIFIDLRDHTGVVQLVIAPEQSEAFKLAESVRDEYVLQAEGLIRGRGEGLNNPHITTGNIEIVVDKLSLLNASEPLPVATKDEGQQSNEELRLKYRYLDLRRQSMQSMLKKRARYYQLIRHYMDDQGFTEVATPILANSSPEGARDFLIPSRVHPGKFYALPQAPQQFKQLLMVGGLDKYYQIAACFRDEDPRADRLYGDFYQLDLEMSFVNDGEVVRQTTEPLIKQLVSTFAGKEIVNDEIPRLTYDDVMNRFGTDKPDLRFDMELVDLTSEFVDTEFGVFKNADTIKAICVKGASSLSRKQIDGFTEIAKQEGAGGLAYIVYEDSGVRSPIAKFLSDIELNAIKRKTGASSGDVVFFGADKQNVVNKVLGRLRNEFADHFDLKDPNKVALAWVVDFPFYEWDEKNKRVDFGHNPFSMPRGGVEALESAKTDDEKLAITADQYDLVMNGYEVCSGAVRNHSPEIMYQAFGLLGYGRQYVEDKFGGMLSAFKFGAPPHAGCAYGLDRIFMVLTSESNIRDVIAFPKNGSGVDLMMQSPSSVDDEQLRELRLRLLDNGK